MPSARKKNLNHKGRNKTNRFTRLDHTILRSPAYHALTTTARALLVELTSLENGKNNGSLYLSVRDAAARLGMSDLTSTGNAFTELQELGFIEMTEDASFHVKAAEKSRARCWRLTWLPGPGGRGPTMQFLQRQPEPGTKAHKRMERGMRALKAYRNALSFGRMPVLDSQTESKN